MSLIEIKGLSKKFGNNVVLDGVDLNIDKGEVVAIIGPSGTGKSTVIKELMKTDSNLKFSVSVTTRAPRAGEQDGVDYCHLGNKGSS